VRYERLLAKLFSICLAVAVAALVLPVSDSTAAASVPSPQYLLAQTAARSTQFGSWRDMLFNTSRQLNPSKTQELNVTRAFTRFARQPARYHSTEWDAVQSSHVGSIGVPFRVETIAISSRLAVRTNGGVWTCRHAARSLAVPRLPQFTTSENFAVVSASTVGPTIIDRVPVWKVQMQIRFSVPYGTGTGQVDEFIAQRGYRVVRETLSSPNLSRDLAPYLEDDYTQHDYSGYGQPVHFQIPSVCQGR